MAKTSSRAERVIKKERAYNKLTKQRSYFVVKSNDIIQRSRFSLTAEQQTIIMYLISRIKPEDHPSTQYTFDISEFCQLCRITLCGKNYDDLKANIQEIASKTMWLDKGNGKSVLLSWFSRVELNSGEGTITIRFHEDMFPFLFDLHERYTSFSLSNILPMRSKYSIRIYELLRSFVNMESDVSMSIDELRQRIDAVGIYDRFPDFKRYVLDRAMIDINGYTDITAEYHLAKTKGSRGYDRITFKIDYYRKYD